MFIYLKTHRVTGLKYLGITKNNPHSYRGSGKYWLRHIRKHGNDVETIILFETKCQEELEQKCMFYSNVWNVESSEEFANLGPETGKTGTGMKGEKNGMYGRKHTEHSIKKISDSKKGSKLSEENKNKMSRSRTGKVPNHETKEKLSNSKLGNKNPMFGKSGELSPRYNIIQSEETKRKISEKAKNRPKKVCPHCSYSCDSSNYAKYHGDKCKSYIAVGNSLEQ